MIWPVTFVQPTGRLASVSSISKATPILCISFAIALRQKSLPFFSSISYACLMLRGTSIPYLCVVFRILDFTAEMITSRLRSVYGTHQTNAGSSEMLRAFANSAVSTGCDSFISFKGIHCSLPSFHLARSCHPQVVCRMRLFPLLVFVYRSGFCTAEPSFL